jgi:hypothetical protein
LTLLTVVKNALSIFSNILAIDIPNKMWKILLKRYLQTFKYMLLLGINERRYYEFKQGKQNSNKSSFSLFKK